MVDVGQRQRDDAGGPADDGVRREVLGAVVFKPHQALALRVVPIVEPAAGHDVHVAIAIEIAGIGDGGAVEAADVAEFEREVALVFQPFHAVIRLGIGLVVERVAIGEQDVGVLVAIHVDHLHAGRSEHGVRPAVQRGVGETALPLVHEGHDRLVLLRDQAHEVDLPIVVQIDRGNVQRAGDLQYPVWHELAAAQVFKPRQFAHVTATEDGHADVEVAVVVDVQGARIGHPADLVQQHLLLEFP